MDQKGLVGNSDNRAVPFTVGGEQSPVNERLKLLGRHTGEVIQRHNPFRSPALLIDGHQIQQGGDHLLGRDPDRTARLLQRRIGLTLQRPAHAPDVDVSLVRE